MKILLADDEELILESEKETIQKTVPDAEIVTAVSSREVLEKAQEGTFTVIFLDIEMPGMSGLELAKRLKGKQPRTNIVFVTAYTKYALQAHELFASGYVLKPLTVTKVNNILENLRYLIEEKKSGLWVQCFGKFEVYYDGQPVNFKRSKAKEVFAYLIDLKGATASTADIVVALWEDSINDKKNHKHLWTLIGELKRVLKQYDAESVLIHQQNSYAINTELLDCDYYRYLKGDIRGINAYTGEYMRQYSWSEVTQAWLEWN